LLLSNVDVTVVIGVLTATRTFDYDFSLFAAVEVRKMRKLDVNLS
jgi:hypothetical protein